MKVLRHIAIASLTFSLGVGVTTAANFPVNLTLSLIFFFAVPLIIIAIVFYQGAWLKKPRRPAIGKGFLAVFIWPFPSSIVVVGNLFCYLESLAPQPIGYGGSSVVLFFLNAVYGAIGWTLCRWVRRYDEENHWLLRNNDLR